MTITTEKTKVYPTLSKKSESSEIYYGILIEPKDNLDLKVNGKVIFKKIKISFYDFTGNKRFFSNEGEFEIELNGIGTNRYSIAGINGVGVVCDLSMIKNMAGKDAFPDCMAVAKLGTLHYNNNGGFYRGYAETHVVEYDAYFEGTVEKR